MLYVWETLKQFFRSIAAVFWAAFIVAGQCGMDLQLHQSNYLAQLVTNGILDSSQEIDQRVQTSEGKSLPEAQIPKNLLSMTILEITQQKVVYSEQVL
jgi:hypothetical protein